MNAAVLLYTIIFGLGIYLFICLIIHKVCEKFGVGSLFECCIPIYQTVLICRCAQISGWNTLWYILPSLFFTVGDLLAIPFVINAILSVVIWGRIAERMGRGYWSYGLGSVFLLGIPILVLAFGEAQPVENIRVPLRLEKDDPEPIYRPIPPSHIETPSRSNSSSGRGVYCHQGDLRGNLIPLPVDGLTIGRDKNLCQIVAFANEVSRTHARIVPGGKGINLTDLGSSNGTYVQQNGEWKKIGDPISLGVGERFRIGKGYAEFEVR